MDKDRKFGWYLGEYQHNLTDRNRLALPKGIRTEIEGNDVILSQGFDNCIYGFDKDRWKQIANEQLAVQLNEERGRELRRKLFASARIIEIDNQGRVVLPEKLLEWANLKGKVGEPVIIIGVGDHFEIWNQTNWEKTKK
jgi:MraZ protein